MKFFKGTRINKQESKCTSIHSHTKMIPKRMLCTVFPRVQIQCQCYLSPEELTSDVSHYIRCPHQMPHPNPNRRPQTHTSDNNGSSAFIPPGHFNPFTHKNDTKWILAHHSHAWTSYANATPREKISLLQEQPSDLSHYSMPMPTSNTPSK